MTRPVEASEQPCYGMCCPMHGRCARYHAVEGMASHHVAIISCATPDGQRPRFIAARAVSLELVAA